MMRHIMRLPGQFFKAWRWQPKRNRLHYERRFPGLIADAGNFGRNVIMADRRPFSVRARQC